VTAYGREDGALTASSGPVIGRADETTWTVLLFFSETKSDLPAR